MGCSFYPFFTILALLRLLLQLFLTGQILSSPFYYPSPALAGFAAFGYVCS